MWTFVLTPLQYQIFLLKNRKVMFRRQMNYMTSLTGLPQLLLGISLRYHLAEESSDPMMNQMGRTIRSLRPKLTVPQENQNKSKGSRQVVQNNIMEHHHQPDPLPMSQSLLLYM